ncbi:MAG: cysteine synthase, partial [Deltaproteobacteria bacterium]|nr:cysteine synthase [Deltaproteobacteria bacterium]
MSTGSIIDLIGNTPLVRLQRLNPNPKVELWVKLEYLNPGGSVKDRPALNMIEAAEADGRLTKEKVILEATSGNTGIGLCLVAAAKGYRVLMTMAESASLERRKILTAFGAEIRLTPAHLSTDGAIEEAYRLAREEPDKYFLVDQFNNPDNVKAHVKTTGPEIRDQTNGRITHFVATLGTTGTIMSCSEYLKSKNTEVQIVAVEPFIGHKIQGLKNMKESYKPGIFDKNRCDRIVNVDDADAYEMARRLAREEGVFVGMSSGAAVWAALKLCQELEAGVVVTILPDTGERYLSTPLFEAVKPPALRLYNTLTRSKEPFRPLTPGQVKIYTCGPTAAGLIHVGNGRRYVVADLLRRTLESKGLKVEHVVNITDLSDKTIEGSEAAGEDLKTFTERYIEEFFKDIKSLRIKPASAYPKVSEHVAEMTDLAQRLVNRGYAYEKWRSLYFDISRLPSYGRLSNIDLSKIKVGKTVDLEEYEKENPRDFTLLKRSTLAELKRGIYWESQWGNVRPSWNLECAAMASAHLGERFDIHTSSVDLIFPHHENTLA